MREEIRMVETIVDETNSRLEPLINQVKVLKTKRESVSIEIKQTQKENKEIREKIERMEKYSPSNNLFNK